MAQEQWNAVDRYICDLVVPADPALDACLAASAAAGLPAINVAPNQGKFLHLLARLQGAKKILEIGTLGGYSTIWLARALPKNGRLVTLEFEPKHAEVAKVNIANAGLADVVDVRVGPAIRTLPTLVDQGPFDFVFIDADKISTADYFLWALKLTRVGSVIIVDNVVRDGNIIDPDSSDEGVHGVRKFNDLLIKETRVSATAIQTVGSKGYDGFAILLVTADGADRR
jgi:predicted O-methyltransferase YrrM